MNVLDDLGKAFKEMIHGEPPAAYTAAAKQVRCGHCDNETFVKHRVLVRGPLAYCLLCTVCGLAMWFDKPPERKQG